MSAIIVVTPERSGAQVRPWGKDRPVNVTVVEHLVTSYPKDTAGNDLPGYRYVAVGI
jgi:hypothetical protein